MEVNQWNSKSENWTLAFEVKRSAGVQESGAFNTDEIGFNLFNHWDRKKREACRFEMFIINSDNEIIEDAMNGGNSVDRIKSVKLEKLEDISYRVVINVFPEIEMQQIILFWDQLIILCFLFYYNFKLEELIHTSRRFAGILAGQVKKPENEWKRTH